MSLTSTPTNALTATDHQGGSNGARDPMQQAADSVQQVAGKVGDQIREEIGTRSTDAGNELHAVSNALRHSTDELRSSGNDIPAKMIEPAAEKVEQLAGYLRSADADQILRDVENFGRKQPWTVIVGGIALGFVASRFLKASSVRRHGQLSSRTNATGGGAARTTNAIGGVPSHTTGAMGGAPAGLR